MYTEIEKEFTELIKAFENFADKWADYEPIIEVQIYHKEVTRYSERGLEANIDAEDFGASLTLVYDNYKYADDYDE